MTQPIPDNYKNLTFEKVWAALMENREQMKETDRKMKETDRQMKETDRKIGELSNRFGEMAEHLVAPGIEKKFNELGYHFGSVLDGGQKIKDKSGIIRTQIDILLENSEFIVAVEIKTKPAKQDVEQHMQRLEILREYRNQYNDKRKIRGAIAGAIFPENVKTTVLEAGMYVLEQSGDTILLNKPDDTCLREW